MGNFQGRRLLWFESHQQKFSPWKFWTCHTHLYGWFCESFLHKILTFYRSVKVFSLKSFPLYSVGTKWHALYNLHLWYTATPAQYHNRQKLSFSRHYYTYAQCMWLFMPPSHAVFYPPVSPLMDMQSTLSHSMWWLMTIVNMRASCCFYLIIHHLPTPTNDVFI